MGFERVPIILELFADDPDASGGKVKPTDDNISALNIPHSSKAFGTRLGAGISVRSMRACRVTLTHFANPI